MLFNTLLSALTVAAVVKALPSPRLEDRQSDIEVFKRDAIIDARDLELAEMHRVNLTEMYKHAIIKRDDGDHINIWVHRSFAEDGGEEEQDLVKRQQKVRLGQGADFDSGESSDRCYDHTRDIKTNSNSPFTGGLKAMFQWADTRSGGFSIGSGGAWQELVVAGSKSGSNAVHRVQAVGSFAFEFGIKDVRNDVDWTLGHAKEFNGRWRASSTGRETCAGYNNRVRYQVVHTGTPV